MIIAESEAEGHLFLTSPATSTCQSSQPPYTILQFQQHTHPEAFAQALALRLSVFVEEQHVPIDEDHDEWDETATHWLILDSITQTPVATGRLLDYQEGCQTRPVAKIGRIAVHKNYRGQKLGEMLMNTILEAAKTSGYNQAILDAQTQALPFYEKLGFIAEGFEFEEAGILHYQMRLLF